MYLIVKMWSDLGAKELPIPILPPQARHEGSRQLRSVQRMNLDMSTK